MDLSFTTTACCRPDLYKVTLDSFNDLLNVKLDNFVLYLNVDPFPKGCDQMVVVELSKKYFKDVVYRCPDEPNFASAVDWCWCSADTEYIFHLEDDWRLIRNVDLGDIIKTMKSCNKLQCVLRAYDYFYDRMALSPSVISDKLYKRFAGKFVYNVNPEVQLRNKFVSKCDIIAEGKKPIVVDIGRSWLRSQSFERTTDKANFVRY